MSTLKVSTISPLGTDATKTITIGASGDVAAGVFTNVPAFEAVLSSDQSVSNNTVTKIQFDTEVLDTDNCYDNSTNYRFTPTKAGKYFVYAQVDCYAGGASDLNVANLRLYKNGSQIHFAYSEFSNNNIQTITRNINTTVDMNGSSDYLECFCDINGASGGGEIFQGYQRRTNFGAYKIIGA
jgi:hypothetical protein